MPWAGVKEGKKEGRKKERSNCWQVERIKIPSRDLIILPPSIIEMLVEGPFHVFHSSHLVISPPS